MRPQDITIQDIVVGEKASFSRQFTEEDMRKFAILSGDDSLIHTDEAYAQTTKFKHRLLYGMLLTAACSKLLGIHVPRGNSVCLSQSLSFNKPLFVNDTVEIEGTVIAKSVSTGIVNVEIHIRRGKEEVAVGEARVQML